SIICSFFRTDTHPHGYSVLYLVLDYYCIIIQYFCNFHHTSHTYSVSIVDQLMVKITVSPAVTFVSSVGPNCLSLSCPFVQIIGVIMASACSLILSKSNEINSSSTLILLLCFTFGVKPSPFTPAASRAMSTNSSAPGSR